jgi:FKBP-type peptidyl-prolyl cis-trans isomerase FklB
LSQPFVREISIMSLKRYRASHPLRGFAVILCLCFPPAVALAGGLSELKDDNDRISYSVGYQVGGDFKRQGLTINREALVKGIEDALGETATPLMSPEAMRATLIDLKKRVVAGQDRQKTASAESYRGEGRAFLTANAGKEGVVTLPSGLQYKVLTEGSGRHPAIDDTVTVSYRGTLIDGSEFDSSLRSGKPMIIALNNVIAGWKEALPLMKEGAKWQLFIPADLAFGERGPLADRTVIYEIELHAVEL